MKKILAILLALMLVLVNVAALAEEGNPPADNGETPVTEPNTGDNQSDAGSSSAPELHKKAAAPTAAQTIEISKVYVVENTTDGYILPPDELTFTLDKKEVTGTSTVTTFGDASITVDPITGVDDQGNNVTTYKAEIGLPAYTGVGIYYYTFTEDNNSVAGVKYIEGDLTLRVTVVQQGDNLVIAGIALRAGGEDGITDDGYDSSTKIDTLENEYENGSLTVKKTVDGNMGDRSRKFSITVTFTAPAGETVAAPIPYGDDQIDPDDWTVNASGNTASVTIELAHDEEITFENIPEGVEYTVVEDAYNETTKKGTLHNGSNSKQNQDKDYAYYVEDEVTTATAITVGEDTPVTIKNTKDIDIDTGVALDSSVYVLIMALTLVGVAVLALRRREEY